ncbi:hypothetical protein [Roseibium marinum]|uniref:Uncharacterized protein n=1 Tax=Roseibium marinum TaxID=281252 RepID=A0A2S3UYD5_9HYPH|nr:hypothetical protein [Roseibium marinum]POF32610.1 hypothetical protein CLV41_10212 [Roseibium marinum]
MSLLSSTQGTPERVWSLVSLLATQEGQITRAEAEGWLNPTFLSDGAVVSEKSTAFSQVLGAATSLGVVEADGDELRLVPSCTTENYAGFGDWVHEHLAKLDSLEKDAVVLETFAWLAVESDRKGGTGWISEETNSSFADAADEALPEGKDDDGERRINATKLPTWRRWLISLGLMVPLPLSTNPFHPLIEGRLVRELAKAGIEQGKRVSADDFINILSARMPYLDRGRMYLQTMRRIGHERGARRLSPILSSALRNLHDEGLIEFQRPGDSGDLVHLSADQPHRFEAFQSVIYNGTS